MSPRFPTRSKMSLFCLLLLLIALPLLAQETPTPPPEEEEELTSAIKKISISVHGGHFGGATYFDLPILDERAQLQEGTNFIQLFNGKTKDIGTGRPYNDIGAPFEKRLDSGNFVAARFGFYLNDSIHLDISGSYTTASASIHVTNYVYDQNEGMIGPGAEGFTEADGYIDNGFKVYMGGMTLLYDAYEVKRFGLVPYFGFGFGGIINRFTELEDKTALYFQLVGGFALPITKSFRLEAQAMTTTYSFSTEEVEYNNQVVSSNFSLGATLMFDVKPIYNR